VSSKLTKIFKFNWKKRRNEETGKIGYLLISDKDIFSCTGMDLGSQETVGVDPTGSPL
jgi:hypothetical protein